nr:unnamed protein product [Callosobruchus analis]
MMNFLDSY